MKSESWDGSHPAGAITWAPSSSWREQHLLRQPVVIKVHLRKVTCSPLGGASSLWIIHSLDNCSRLIFVKNCKKLLLPSVPLYYSWLAPMVVPGPSSSLISLRMDSPSPHCFLACSDSRSCFCLPGLVPASHHATLTPVYKAVASNTVS